MNPIVLIVIAVFIFLYFLLFCLCKLQKKPWNQREEWNKYTQKDQTEVW